MSVAERRRSRIGRATFRPELLDLDLADLIRDFYLPDEVPLSLVIPLKWDAALKKWVLSKIGVATEETLEDVRDRLPSSLTLSGNLRVSIQEQNAIVYVRDTLGMLVQRASVAVGPGGTGVVTLTVPSNEIWEVGITNNIGSGAHISLVEIDVSPDGGTTFYAVKTAHIGSGEKLYITPGNMLKATFQNTGAAIEYAYFTVVGRRLKYAV